MSAHLHLRYRPASDVLSGDIELGTLAADHRIVETPDADTSIEWSPGIDLAEMLLAGFRIVHASALIDSDAPAMLPHTVIEHARQLVRTGRAALRRVAPALEQLQVRADIEAEVSVDQLVRPRSARIDHRPAAHHDARPQGAALERVADALALQPGDEAAQLRTDDVVRLLRELAAVLRGAPGSTSPGTSAAARHAVTGDVPLTSPECARLRWALHALDEPAAWHLATCELEALADDLLRAATPAIDDVPPTIGRRPTRGHRAPRVVTD